MQKLKIFPILLLLCLCSVSWAVNDFSRDINCMTGWDHNNGALTTDSQRSMDLTNEGVTASTGDFKEGDASGLYTLSDPDVQYIADASLEVGFPLKVGGLGTYSVTFWFKLNSLPTAPAVQRIAFKGTTTPAARCFDLHIEDSEAGDPAHRFRFNHGYNGGGNWETFGPTAKYVVADRWFFIAQTYDNISKDWTHYAWDDTLESVVSNIGGTLTNNINLEAGRFLIGADQTTQGAEANHLDGLIDEMRWFRDVLTDAEASKIRQGIYAEVSPANVFSGDPTCKAVWPLEPDSLIADIQGTNTLTNNNTVSASANWKEGFSSGQFDSASSRYMSVADTDLDSGFPLKNGEANKDITICMWVWFFTLPGEAAGHPLFTKYNTVDDKRSIFLGTITTGGDTKFRLMQGHTTGTGLEVGTVHPTVLAAGRWYHLKVTYVESGFAYDYELWDDTGQSETTSNDTFSQGISVRDSPVEIGSFSAGTGTHNGLIDEVVIYDRAITADENEMVREMRFGSGSQVISIMSKGWTNFAQELIDGKWKNAA